MHENYIPLVPNNKLFLQAISHIKICKRNQFHEHCIYILDCPIPVSIHFNINFSHFPIECLIFAILFALFIFYNANILALSCFDFVLKSSRSSSSCHHRMWHTFPPTYTHTPWIWRKNLSNHLSWRQFLGPGHLRFLLHVWHIKKGKEQE